MLLYKVSVEQPVCHDLCQLTTLMETRNLLPWNMTLSSKFQIYNWHFQNSIIKESWGNTYKKIHHNTNGIHSENIPAKSLFVIIRLVKIRC